MKSNTFRTNVFGIAFNFYLSRSSLIPTIPKRRAVTSPQHTSCARRPVFTRRIEAVWINQDRRGLSVAGTERVGGDNAEGLHGDATVGVGFVATVT